MAVVFFAWIFFRAKNFSLAVDMLILMASGDWLHTKLSTSFYELLIIFVLVHIIVHKTSSISLNKIGFFRLTLCSVFLSLIATIYYVDGSDFIYFQF